MVSSKQVGDSFYMFFSLYCIGALITLQALSYMTASAEVVVVPQKIMLLAHRIIVVDKKPFLTVS